MFEWVEIAASGFGLLAMAGGDGIGIVDLARNIRVFFGKVLKYWKKRYVVCVCGH